MFGLPGLSGLLTAPSTGVGLTDLAKSAPITTIAPTYKSPAPSGGAKTVGYDAGQGLSGAGSGAIAGGTVAGPWGALGGGILGLLNGFAKPSTSTAGAAATPTTIGKGSGLTDAFGLGLSSLGNIIPGLNGGAAGPVTQTNSQEVNNVTSVNVSNILGGKAFGGITEDGNFDTFQAISDVFKIREVMNQNNQTMLASTTPASVLNQTAKDYRPFILLGGAALALFLLMRR